MPKFSVEQMLPPPPKPKKTVKSSRVVGKKKSTLSFLRKLTSLGKLEDMPGSHVEAEVNDIISGATDGRLAADYVAPTQISQIFDRTSVRFDPNPGHQIRDAVLRWRSRLYYFGMVSDTFDARSGDLRHDIGDAITELVPPARRSMREFIETYPIPAIAGRGAEVDAFVRSLPSVMRVFNTYRRNQFVPELFKRNPKDPSSLKPLTDSLRATGVQYIVYDAGFGNIFKDGFGKGMANIISSAGDADGGSKIGDATLSRFGVNSVTDYRPFVVHDFYGNDIKHTISVNDDGMKQVTISKRGGVVLGGAGSAAAEQHITIECETGFSVNAICNAVGITAPRGSGEAGSPITIIDEDPIPNSRNHIVFIKTLTDWAQLVYALLQTALGRKCVFITNDEYCLALGAALGVPYMIRTPYAACDYVELYKFDPAVEALTSADEARIRRNLSVIDPNTIRTLRDNFNQKRDRVEYCMTTSRVPEIIRIQFIADYNEVGRELNTIFDFFGKPEDDYTIEQVRRYRSLINNTAADYIRNEMKRHLSELHTKYVAFGVTMQTELHTNIRNDPDTIPRVVSLISSLVGNDRDHILGVFGFLGGNDLRIENRHDAPAMGGWVTYYAHYLRVTLNSDYVAVRYQDERFFPRARKNWDDQMMSLKWSMWELIRDIPTLTAVIPQPTVRPEALCFRDIIPAPAAGAEVAAQFVQAGGAGGDTIPGGFPIDDDDREYIEKEIKFIKSVPSDSGYTPSCSDINDILAEVPTSFSSIEEKIEWILNTMKKQQIDAYESNMGKEFEILMSDLDQLYEAMKAGEITPTTMRKQLEYVLTVHDVLVAIRDGISPDNQRTLFSLIESIDAGASSVSASVTEATTSSSTSEASAPSPFAEIETQFGDLARKIPTAKDSSELTSIRTEFTGLKTKYERIKGGIPGSKEWDDYTMPEEVIRINDMIASIQQAIGRREAEFRETLTVMKSGPGVVMPAVPLVGLAPRAGLVSSGGARTIRRRRRHRQGTRRTSTHRRRKVTRRRNRSNLLKRLRGTRKHQHKDYRSDR